MRMKWIATGLLVLAALVYVVSEKFDYYYLAAFSEAAMVGALADWFAVVALFRRPLNLPIPHTAIIPRNKDRIARGLSEFIEQNFLSSAAVVQRIAEFRPAHTLCQWLLKPDNVDTVAGYATRFVAYALTAVDDERVRRFLHQNIIGMSKNVDFAAAAAQVLDVLTENKRHHALLDAALRGLDDLLAKEETRRFIAAGTRTMQDLLGPLQAMTGRPVIDRTGLIGAFDFDLQWTSGPVALAGGPTAPPDDGPSIFVALQEQLGLRLEPGRAPFDVVVVDAVQRPTPD